MKNWVAFLCVGMICLALESSGVAAAAFVCAGVAFLVEMV